MSSAYKALSPKLIIILAGLFLFGSGGFAAADDAFTFKADDTLEEIREKIELNGYSFTVSNNAIFSLPQAEKDRLFSRRKTDSALKRKIPADPGPLAAHLGISLPSSFDWRNRDGKSYIGPIRDQGSCGSCYAFGAAAAAEGTYNKAMDLYDDNAVDFSEAFIAFCLDDHYPENFSGCEGSDYEYMELQALVDYGMIDDSVYAYIGESQECPMDSYPPLIRFQSWHRIQCQDIDAIKAAIMTYGVVDAAVYVTSAFLAYKSGVYEDQNNTCDADPCYYAPTSHVIALVGWEDNPPEGGDGCWILRNSWGENWGENGYMRIRYTSAAVSCEATYLVYESTGPTVATGTATGINETTAQLNGTVNPGGLDSQYYFEYGDTTDLGETTPEVSIAAATVNLAVTQTVTGLTPLTTYYFKVLAGNAEGINIGAITSFTTTGDAIPPTVHTLDAEVDFNAAVLNATINAHNVDTAYYFEYGPDTTAYGQATTPQRTLDGTVATNVEENLDDLQWGETYFYRAVAENEHGISYGEELTFPSRHPPIRRWRRRTIPVRQAPG